MKIKLTLLMEALQSLKNDYSSYYGEHYGDCELDISLVEENPGEGKIMACLLLKANTSVRTSSSSYENGKSSLMDRCVEICDNSQVRLIKTEILNIKL